MLFSGLAEWVREHGGTISEAVAVTVTAEDGRGVYATEQLRSKQLLFALPPESLLLSQAAQSLVPRSVWIRDDWDDSELLPEDLTALALLLIAEKRKGAAASAWGAYIDSLPTAEDLADFPVLWPADQAENEDSDRITAACTVYGLQDYPLARQTLRDEVVSLRRDVRTQYETIRQRVADTWPDAIPGGLREDEYTWAWCMVCSRTFDCDTVAAHASGGGDGNDPAGLAVEFSPAFRRSAMAPFLDMVNHVSEATGLSNVSWSFDGNGELCVHTTRAVEAGEQLRFDYNSNLSNRSPIEIQPSWYFTRFYGFSPPNVSSSAGGGGSLSKL